MHLRKKTSAKIAPSLDIKVQKLHNCVEVRNMIDSIKELRNKYKLTQAEAAELTGIPIRTFKDYENNPSRIGSIKYNYIVQRLKDYGYVDETHGILTQEYIVSVCGEVLSSYPVQFCYLFGSYAKGNANERSDVDLLISTDLSGLRFYGLAERLREALGKKVDLINVSQLNNNMELLNEVLKDGIKIYEEGQ